MKKQIKYFVFVVFVALFEHFFSKRYVLTG